jgi:hypothetical protein
LFEDCLDKVFGGALREVIFRFSSNENTLVFDYYYFGVIEVRSKVNIVLEEIERVVNKTEVEDIASPFSEFGFIDKAIFNIGSNWGYVNNVDRGINFNVECLVVINGE